MRVRAWIAIAVVLFLGVSAAGAASAATVTVPLTVDPHYLRERAAEALGMGPAGRVRLARDACARADLSDLALTTAGGRPELSVAVAATLATPAFGRCIGVGTWRGRLRVELDTAVAPGGRAVRLRPASAELLGEDGEATLLTTPTRLLAEAVVLPRLERLTVDVAEPLAAIDALVEESLAGRPDAPALAERVRITAVDSVPEGMRLTLGLTVSAPAAGREAPEPALDAAELARWRRVEDELDGFLTTVVRWLAERSPDRDHRLELQAVLLDTRFAVAEALAREGDGDPVRALFLRSWERLRPLVEAMEPGALPEPVGGLRLAAFVAAGDALRALDTLGPAYGLEISRDGLRRLARTLLGAEAPDAFTPLPLEVDPRLRKLFEVGVDGPADRGDAARAPAPLAWLIAAARAAPDPAAALANRAPSREDLAEYLDLVAALLEAAVGERLAGGTDVPERFRDLLAPLVKATAWKESCWRQYRASPDGPVVLRSGIGAVGMMQINGRVWRGIYDLDRLAGEVGYNVGAGIDILEHYLVDYALRRGEHEQSGDPAANLVRATYAAYNGGPGQMARYRRPDTPQRLRAIDAAFWDHYTAVRRDGRPAVDSCYSW